MIDLHRHDEYSTFDGFGKPEELAELAKELGYTKVMWVANTAACRICEPHDGKKYTLNEADGIIPVHPNCLCSWVAVD